MSVKLHSLSSDYVVNLNYTPSSKVEPVNAHLFFSALRNTYDEKSVVETFKWFIESDQSSPGIKDFNDRLDASLIGGELLSGDDQKYIADVVCHVFNGVF